MGSPEGISVSVVHFSKQHKPDLHNRCVWGQASAWESSCGVTECNSNCLVQSLECMQNEEKAGGGRGHIAGTAADTSCPYRGDHEGHILHIWDVLSPCRRRPSADKAASSAASADSADKFARSSADGVASRAAPGESAGKSPESSATRKTSRGIFKNERPSEEATAEGALKEPEPVDAAKGRDHLKASASEEASSEEASQESGQASGVRRKAAVQPLEDASEDLQEPKFIKIGGAAVDEL